MDFMEKPLILVNLHQNLMYEISVSNPENKLQKVDGFVERKHVFSGPNLLLFDIFCQNSQHVVIVQVIKIENGAAVIKKYL